MQKKKINEIWSKSTPEQQLVKLEEECIELVDALNSGNVDETIGEIADVLNLCLQFYYNDKRVKKALKFKINRTIERFEEGYYEEALIGFDDDLS